MTATVTVHAWLIRCDGHTYVVYARTPQIAASIFSRKTQCGHREHQVDSPVRELAHKVEAIDARKAPSA